MKLDQEDPITKKITKVVVTWRSHMYECEKCRDIDIEKSAQFANACVLGSQLIMEELVARQRPAQLEKQRAILEWAKNAGVFKINGRTPSPIKYVEKA